MPNSIKYIILFLLLCVNTPQVHAQNVYADIVANPVLVDDRLFSLVVYLRNADHEIETNLSGEFQLNTEEAILQENIIHIKKGVGSLTTKVTATEDFNVSLEGFQGEKYIHHSNPLLIPVEGELEENTTWNSDKIYLVNSDFTVPAGIKLHIEKGTGVYLQGDVNIFVFGSLEIAGTADEPVLFNSWVSEHTWGGIILDAVSDSLSFRHCFFISGGGNEDFIFGHSDSQPVMMIKNSSVGFTNCYFLDNTGKAIGAKNSVVGIKDCVISRNDTGGEYHQSVVDITHSWYIDIPDGNGVEEDNDNDASYFFMAHEQISRPSKVANSYFITGDDDGLDHNGANLVVEDCWIEGFNHEGIAGSNENKLVVNNTLVKGCDQGIEAGYGSPLVEVNHCTMVENGVGLRFGDDKLWGCSGLLSVTNSIMHLNDDNIKNFDQLTQAPVEDAIEISYSVTNDEEYDAFPACITGSPDFDDLYLLLPGSIGIGMASDGGNMGLVDVHLNGITNPGDVALNISPNPFTNTLSLDLPSIRQGRVQLRIVDAMGVEKISKFIESDGSNVQVIDFLTSTWPSGIYIVMLYTQNELLGIQKTIKK